MSKGKGLSWNRLGRVPEIVRGLAADEEWLSTSHIARVAGVSRQAAHYHVVRMVADGELVAAGAGRGAKYRLASDLSRTYLLEGLEEHAVWVEVADALPTLGLVGSSVSEILAHAFTEMLNNAIDHSRGTIALVRGWVEGRSISFEIADDGIGVFSSIRSRLGLVDQWAALEELAKGKATTAPEAHSGEGIFFTSKSVDRFELEDASIRWVVDNVREDQSVGESMRRNGTRVRFDVAKDSTRSLAGAFDTYAPAEDFEFSVTQVPVHLFETGTGFVSRSEAKRVTARLELFRRVELDFRGVRQVGLGFADEVFRVWAAAHPEVELVPTHMSPMVERVVNRARGSGAQRPRP
jgi:anti-sigma regulatory factor (Ser/Thr protein kinase)